MKPTRPKASKPKTDSTLSTVVSSLVGLTVVLGGGAGLYFWTLPQPSQPITVQVQLDNRCEVLNEAFMAVAEPYGTKSYFTGHIAVLATKSDAKIYVRSSDKYPSFYFESPRVDAAKKVTIKTICDGGQRIERTLDALKEQFKPDKIGRAHV